jgi:O-antigen/teichoic acid export membrane protein
MLSMPTMFIIQAVGEVFKKRASMEFHTTGNCLRTFKRTFFTLALLSLLPFLIIFLFGPALFGFVFGMQWVEAGTFTRIMVLMFFLRFTISPLTFVTYLRGRQVIGLVGTIVYALSTIIVCYLIATNTSNVYYLLMGYVANFTWVYLCMFYINFKLAKGDEL